MAENNHPYPWMAMERYDRENVLLDDFTPMLTPESNLDVTSPRSNKLSTSNHVSLDSRHWSPSSGGLRSGLCLYVIALKYGIAYTMCTHCAYGSAAGSFVYDVTTHSVCSLNECIAHAGISGGRYGSSLPSTCST
ncbi:hypothetical protein Tco_0352310 [Tanacetum coccineum]